MLGAAGVERDSAQGVSSVFPNWKGALPKDSNGKITYQFMQVHNKLNNTHLALMHYSWAMDLDPKVQHQFHVMLLHNHFYWLARCHYNLAQGANSQVKDALDPALNRVGQELG